MGGGNVKGQGEVQTKHVGSRQGNICPSVSREVPVNSYCPSFVNDIISFQFQKRPCLDENLHGYPSYRPLQADVTIYDQVFKTFGKRWS